MLPNLRHVMPAILRQCARHSACVQYSRALTTAPQRRQSDLPRSYGTPNWIDEGRKMQQNTSPLWEGLVQTARLPFEPTDSGAPAEEIWKSMEKSHVRNLPRPNDAYSGRSVSVIKGEVTLALAKLRGILTINPVRSTNIRDERHEKKGEKRNRLRSLRWRRRFAHEVRKRVQLVNEIRARGA